MTISVEIMTGFEGYLRSSELAAGTVGNYLRHVRLFLAFAGGRELSRGLAAEWKEALRRSGRTVETVNGMLVSLGAFFKYLGCRELTPRLLRVQRRVFRDENRELSQREYERLLAAAKPRLALLMETICGTGIRVSEAAYITVEAAKRREAEVSLKGKVRRILIPGKLAKKLLRYAKERNIRSGAIFITRNGTPMSRRQIWAEMKALCKKAKVEETKVFPHNLRHLFARLFYRASRDMVKLADVLGHSSIETTRIYLISTGEEHRRQLEKMKLIH